MSEQAGTMQLDSDKCPASPSYKSAEPLSRQKYIIVSDSNRPLSDVYLWSLLWLMSLSGTLHLPQV